MKKIICDICGENEGYEFKYRDGKARVVSYGRVIVDETEYYIVDICKDCYIRILESTLNLQVSGPVEECLLSTIKSKIKDLSK